MARTTSGSSNIVLADAPVIASDGAPQAVGAAAPSQVWAAVWTGRLLRVRAFAGLTVRSYAFHTLSFLAVLRVAGVAADGGDTDGCLRFLGVASGPADDRDGRAAATRPRRGVVDDEPAHRGAPRLVRVRGGVRRHRPQPGPLGAPFVGDAGQAAGPVGWARAGVVMPQPVVGTPTCYSDRTMSTEISTAGTVPLFSSQCVVFRSSGQPTPGP